ncbi:MAG TPA: SCO family protein [Acidobacteriaceae bacterium]
MKIFMQGCAVMGLALALGVSGCRRAAAPAQQTQGNAVTFPLKGSVVSTDAAAGEVTVDAEAIPGFMEAMAMPYKLAQPEVIGELHPGDRITGVIRTTKDEGGFHDAKLDQIVIVAQSKPDYKPAVQYHVPQVGEELPDFKLTNQSGKAIHLSQFRGKALLLTFIYTRCPLADFCPKMSENFAQIDHALAADPKLYAKTHLLSISFDPAYDTPAVLRSYGGAYTGKYTNEKFEHWDFAAPTKDDLPRITQFFDVGVTPGEKGTLNHSLSTMLAGKDGKVVGWYPMKDWQPQEMLKAVKNEAAK